MSLAVCCPRCGGAVRRPGLMDSRWRCDRCGPVSPWHALPGASGELLAGVVDHVRRAESPDGPVPLWCPWPLPTGWTVTGVGWAGEERTGPRATAVALTGPAPVENGPADLVFVAEQLGVGLGAGLGGLPGSDAGPGLLDPGPGLWDAVSTTAPHAKIRAGGHPTPLWAVPAGPGRSVYVGEARAIWIYVIAWPAAAGYLLAEGITVHDCVDSVPSELVFGADSGRLRPGVFTRRSTGRGREFGRTD